MKLHIHGNSLRLSVSENDLERLRSEGFLERWMGLGPGKRFTYCLETSSDADKISAMLESDALALVMPTQWADRWASNDDPRLESMQVIDGEQQLHIVLERDARNGHLEQAMT